MINDRGLDIIKQSEGCALQAYEDPLKPGLWTIGYGSTREVYPGMKITVEDADDRLITDLRAIEPIVTRLVQVPINSNQLSALLSFTYNEGSGKFGNSTLLRTLNQGDYHGASDQFLVWDKVSGIVQPGLVRRRKLEQALFNDPNCSDFPTEV